MAEVIELEGRVRKRKNPAELKKLQILRDMLTCGRCSGKCAKCGAHGEPTGSFIWQDAGFNLCADCAAEYQEVMKAMNGEPAGERPFWYNREWLRLWLAWLEYQRTLSSYAVSAEVLLALRGFSPEQ